MKTISFKNKTVDVAANMFYPDNFNESQKYPVIICAHPVGGVKEQTAEIYAQSLSKRGFITVALDASYQGDSGGMPRYLEDPYIRVEDFRACIDYLNTVGYIDSDKIVLLGICGAGGYVVNAAIIDHRINAVIGISAVNVGDMFRLGWHGNEDNLQHQRQMLKDLANIMTLEANGSNQQFMPWAPFNPDDVQSSDLCSAYEYYRTDRAQHANAPSQGILTSSAKLLSYDAFYMADRYLTQPLLLIAGNRAESLWHSEKLINQAGSDIKELFLIDKAGHVDLYDLPQYVNPALEKITSFLQKYL
ncbi:alpha/beta hydrolase [Wohlfahrtiimonas larvae]|uniref:Alpha/beta hydrolase n=1 Tax=Wohlfahrtiimonas larvae TaxID=1157986 RepID=A0ABP9MSK3_9GAMM|nr:alpha/beta hydrolase [Wohlfahrtiimonas larvae]